MRNLLAGVEFGLVSDLGFVTRREKAALLGRTAIRRTNVSFLLACVRAFRTTGMCLLAIPFRPPCFGNRLPFLLLLGCVPCR